MCQLYLCANVPVFKMNGPVANARVVIKPVITTVQKLLKWSVLFVRLSLYSTAFCSRQEEANDIISSVIVDPTSMDVRVKLGDYRPNRVLEIFEPFTL